MMICLIIHMLKLLLLGSNNRCGCIFSKMDKALFDLNLLIAHPKTLVEFLPPGVLDHAAFSISFASKI